MALFKLPRWLKTPLPILVLQIEGTALRFVLRAGQRVLKSGVITLPAHVMVGRAFDVLEVRTLLLAQLDGSAADVAVLLPAAAVHIHFLTVPMGLDEDELDYQTSRHITHELGLSLADVYYDWTQADELSKQGQTVVLAVARQSEVAQYAQLLGDTALRLRWVCAEPLVWAQAYEGTRYAVCKIEHDGMQVYWFEANGRVRVWSKSFDAEQMGRAGFEYISGAVVRLPTRFVVDEIDNALSQILGEADKQRLHSLYVSGAAVNWVDALPALQAGLGVPVRLSSMTTDEHNALGGLWQLSEQILKEKA